MVMSLEFRDPRSRETLNIWSPPGLSVTFPHNPDEHDFLFTREGLLTGVVNPNASDELRYSSLDAIGNYRILGGVLERTRSLMSELIDVISNLWERTDVPAQIRQDWMDALSVTSRDGLFNKIHNFNNVLVVVPPHSYAANIAPVRYPSHPPPPNVPPAFLPLPVVALDTTPSVVEEGIPLVRSLILRYRALANQLACFGQQILRISPPTPSPTQEEFELLPIPELEALEEGEIKEETVPSDLTRSTIFTPDHDDDMTPRQAPIALPPTEDEAMDQDSDSWLKVAEEHTDRRVIVTDTPLEEFWALFRNAGVVKYSEELCTECNGHHVEFGTGLGGDESDSDSDEDTDSADSDYDDDTASIKTNRSMTPSPEYKLTSPVHLTFDIFEEPTGTRGAGAYLTPLVLSGV